MEDCVFCRVLAITPRMHLLRVSLWFYGLSFWLLNGNSLINRRSIQPVGCETMFCPYVTASLLKIPVVNRRRCLNCCWGRWGRWSILEKKYFKYTKHFRQVLWKYRFYATRCSRTVSIMIALKRIYPTQELDFWHAEVGQCQRPLTARFTFLLNFINASTLDAGDINHNPDATVILNFDLLKKRLTFRRLHPVKQDWETNSNLLRNLQYHIGSYYSPTWLAAEVNLTERDARGWPDTWRLEAAFCRPCDATARRPRVICQEMSPHCRLSLSCQP